MSIPPSDKFLITPLFSDGKGNRLTTFKTYFTLVKILANRTYLYNINSCITHKRRLPLAHDLMFVYMYVLCSMSILYPLRIK